MSDDLANIIVARINDLMLFIQLQEFELEALEESKISRLEEIIAGSEFYNNILAQYKVCEVLFEFAHFASFLDNQSPTYVLDELDYFVAELMKLQDGHIEGTPGGNLLMLGLLDRIDGAFETNSETYRKIKRQRDIIDPNEFASKVIDTLTIHVFNPNVNASAPMPIPITTKKPEAKIIPSELVKKLDEYVVGQDHVKRAVALHIANHYNCIRHDPDMKKQGLLIVGDSGTGKTLIVETIAKILDKHVKIVDITEYTKSGYVGKEVSEMFLELESECVGKKLEDSIIFIDEFDKLGETERDEMTKGVQHGLLKLIESDSKSINNRNKASVINTKGICFIFGGAFSEAIKKKREDGKGLGFGRGVDQIDLRKKAELTHEDIHNTGIINELLGRIGVIVQTDPLDDKTLMEIMTKPRGCIEYHYNKLFTMNGLDDKVKKKDLLTILEAGKKLNLGARGLKAMAEKHFRDRLFF